SYDENIKVLIHDHVKNKMFYTNHIKILLDMVYNYISREKGDDGLRNARELFKKNKVDPKLIEQDSTFTSGLFIIERGDKHYELWEKKLEILPGGILYSLGILPEPTNK